MILPTPSLAKYRRQVVMADGSFDPIHPGHLAYLRAAASLGYPLLVNLCPDTETRRKHPILLPSAQRAEVIDALGCVAYVHVSESSTEAVLRELHPVAYVKGADWVDRLPVAVGQVCDELQIRVRYMDTPKQSSTAILKQFQPDVDEFEKLVLSQKPAEKPWEPTAAVPYDFESRKIAEGIHPELIRDVFQARRVLDAGCGPGHLVRMLLENGAGPGTVEGCDVRDSDGTPRWYWHCDVSVPIEYAVWAYDLVICREVLEHLTIRQIRQAVTNLCALSSKFVYVTTRFSQAQHFLDFATADDADPSHISIMSKDWLRHLFVLEGFRRRADLEERLDWQGKNRVLIYERSIGS